MFKRKKLFLDDIRNPKDVFKYIPDPIFLDDDWDVVRSYDEFVAYIKNNKIPPIISFDHDLGVEHYFFTSEKERIPYHEFNEKTGYDCAKWLVEYCLDNNIACPDFFSHSMNPVGRKNINGLLNGFKKF